MGWEEPDRGHRENSKLDLLTLEIICSRPFVIMGLMRCDQVIKQQTIL